jgi:HEAT repeat protein
MKSFKLIIFIAVYLYTALISVPINAEEDRNKEAIERLLSSNKAESDKEFTHISLYRPLELLPYISSAILSDNIHSKKEILTKVLKFYPQRDTAAYCADILNKTNSFLIKKEIIDYISSSLDNKLISLVIRELQNPFFTVRESAILALKKIGNDKVFPYILNMMESSDPVQRVYALEAIFYLYDLRFYNQLINMLKDENKSIRYFVMKCIEANKLREALPTVRNTALNDSSWEVRVKAIQILETLMDKDSLYVLLNCLKDSEREVRYYTAKALNKLLFKASAYSISLGLFAEQDDEIKEMLINTLIAINDAGGYKGLRKVLLSDPNYRMKVIASYALGQIRYNWSFPVLLEGKNDSSKEVRAEICNSLGYYFDKNIIRELIDIMNEDPEMYVRSAALFSIRRIGAKSGAGSRNGLIMPVIPSLFDAYSVEQNPVFKEQIRIVLKEIMKETGLDPLRKS